MTRFLVGTYRLQYVTNLGDERKYEWVVEKESGNTVKVRMTRIDTPWRQGTVLISQDSVSDVKIVSTHLLKFSLQKDKSYPVDVEGTLYQGKLFVTSDFYKIDTGFASDAIPFIKQ
ncbi:hypothetical protein [Dyadobacter sp. 676]|uniref:Uncharacterized protein n=1 Tax=Dyadobacter sp. 676 TaxID=3088362 RepID=A0AAU8FG70_9BACT